LNKYPELTEHYVKPTLNDLGVLTDAEKVPFAKLGQQDALETQMYAENLGEAEDEVLGEDDEAEEQEEDEDEDQQDDEDD